MISAPSGVRLAGLSTQVPPAAIAGPTLWAARLSGTLNGEISGQDPTGHSGGVGFCLVPVREAEPAGHPGTRVDSFERHVWRRDGGASALVDRGRKPEAERGDVVVEESLDHLVELRQERVTALARRRVHHPPDDDAVALNDPREELCAAEVDSYDPLRGHVARLR